MKHLVSTLIILAIILGCSQKATELVPASPAPARSLAASPGLTQGTWTEVPIENGMILLQGDFSDGRTHHLEDVLTEVTVSIGGNDLQIRGTIAKGRYYKDGMIDLSASLELATPFLYRKHPVIATLNSGTIGLTIKRNKLRRATFGNIEADVELGIGADSPLKLKGSVSGSINDSYEVSFDGSIELKNDVEKQFGESVKVGIGSGSKLTIHVKENAFKGAEFTGVVLQAAIDIDGQELSLEGNVPGKINSDYSIDFMGEIKVEGDFTKQFGENVTVTLKDGGNLQVKVEKSEFRWAELDDMVIDVTVTVDQGPLNLRGEIPGKINGSYEVSLDGSLELENDFEKQFGEGITGSLQKGATLTVRVDDNAFKFAELTGMEIAANIDVDGSMLSLEGSVGGKVDENYEIDLDGSISVVKDFNYSLGAVTAFLKEGGTVEVKIADSKFIYAALPLMVTADIDIKGSDAGLKLKGSVDGKISGSYSVDLNGELSVEEDFVYEKDKVTATLVRGGTVTVRVEQSTFRHASLQLNVLVDTPIPNSNGLTLKGSVPGKIDDQSTLNFTGEIVAQEDFVYRKDGVTATLSRGSGVTVKVKQSEFKALTFGVQAEADIDIPRNDPLLLGGELDGKYDSEREFCYRGNLEVIQECPIKLDSILILVPIGSGPRWRDCDNSDPYVRFDGMQVGVTVEGATGRRSITATIDRGFYRDGYIVLISDDFLKLGLDRRIQIKAVLGGGQVVVD